MMKRNILFLFAICASVNLIAQNNIKFTINHKLGDSAFEMQTGAQNNINHDFNVTRLEYYISEISLVHDGGVITDLGNIPILVDASEPVQVDLGMFDVTNVEKIRFFIGVPQSLNHEDPALYPAGHPLAPQFPSMHWGWVSGYRFIAMEGYGGSNFNQRYELHGLGDSNYFQNRITSSATAVDGVIQLNIDADYTRILEDIAVNNGKIEHGETGDAKNALINLRNFVFNESNDATSIRDVASIVDVIISPNPTSGNVNLTFKNTLKTNYDLRLLTNTGQEVANFSSVDTNNTFNLKIEDKGWYILQILDRGRLVSIEKIIIQ